MRACCWHVSQLAKLAGKPAERFLPLPLAGAKDAIEPFDLSKLKSSLLIWVQGNAGMGKSALFGQLLRLYFEVKDREEKGPEKEGARKKETAFQHLQAIWLHLGGDPCPRVRWPFSLNQ